MVAVMVSVGAEVVLQVVLPRTLQEAIACLQETVAPEDFGLTEIIMAEAEGDRTHIILLGVAVALVVAVRVIVMQSIMQWQVR
jgi:hypothetical protein